MSVKNVLADGTSGWPGYLEKLDHELKQSKPFRIDLELDKPETLANKARINLDYLDFFRAWLRAIPSNAPSRVIWEKNSPEVDPKV